MMRVLLVEDNIDLCISLADALESEEMLVDYAHDGLHAFQLAENNEYDVIILDINLPKINGIQLCKSLREKLMLDTPIIMLTARLELEDKLASFDSGADDYLAKPFEVQELIARLKTLTRRKTLHGSLMQVGELSFHTGNLKVERQGRTIQLNSSERKLLNLLMQRSPEVVSRASLEHALWGDEPPEADVLKIHIHNLRQKIDKPFSTAYLKTVRGSGYQLSDS